MNDEKFHPGFYRYSEGVAAGRYASIYGTSHEKDSLMVGMYFEDGGCSFEFAVEEHPLGIGKDTLRVCLFSDAFQAFDDFHAFFRWLADEKPKTLDRVQEWLGENGFRNEMKDEG